MPDYTFPIGNTHEDSMCWVLLNAIIPRILGECRGCNQPCSKAYNGREFADVCICCKQLDEVEAL